MLKIIPSIFLLYANMFEISHLQQKILQFATIIIHWIKKNCRHIYVGIYVIIVTSKQLTQQLDIRWIKWFTFISGLLNMITVNTFLENYNK